MCGNTENREVIRKMFGCINDFKRYRVLAEQSRAEGRTSDAIFNELKMYKAFDSLELYVRRMNANERETFNEEQETESHRAL